MKKFKYRLEALLKMKEHFEKEKQKEHALSLQRVQTQENNLSALESEKNQNFMKQRTKLKGSLSVAEMLVYGRYMIKLKRNSFSGEQMLGALRKQEEGKRSELLEATKEKKIQEKLKEKQHEIYIDDLKLLENNENDEIAGNNFRLKNKR
ncbi:MAG: flagellar FliJ family protein [candidate division Zixibacteria bacterium]|nr:flagellar FliJ family protein [candidate division Zixibacteria bacterium]